MKLPTEKSYEPIKIDFSGLFKKSDYYDEERVNKPIKIDVMALNEKIIETGKYKLPTIPKIDLTQFKKSEVDDSKTVGVWIHPNDPLLDEINKPKPIKSQVPFVPHNPIPSAIQSDLYRQQQKQMYEVGQQYLANRGPVSYQFSNPNGLLNLRTFQDDMNKKLNDPATIIQSIIPKSNNTNNTSFVPVNSVSEEEFKDTYYEREKEERKQYAESLKKNKDFGNPNRDISKDSIPRRRLSYSEMVKRKNNTNTPTIMDNYKSDGDALLHLSSTPFSEKEKQSAFNNAAQQYEEQKRAILNKAPIAYNGGQTVPRFYNPNDYTNYINNVYSSRPQYYSGYGYAGVSGLPDEQGLPTVWFNDNGKYLIPTEEDLSKQSIPVIHTNMDDKNICEKKKEETKTWIIMFSRITETEDGVAVREFCNTKDDTVKQILYDENFDSYEDYSNMGKDSIEQMNDNDTFKIATELSRYNVELADIFAWARNCIDYKQFLYLKRDCLDQLIEYRDADPFCLIKSTVIMNGSTIIVLQPKPTTVEEIDKIIKGLKSIDHTSLKLDNIYKKYIYQLSSSINLHDKLNVLWNARDIEVIPRNKDKAFIKAKSIIGELKDIKVKSNFDRYKFYKNISRANYLQYKKGGVFEKEFAEWWNKPREGLSKNKYEIMYSVRMNDLTIRKLYNLKDPDYNSEVIRKSNLFNQEWERLSDGLFHKPNMTFNDYIVAINVTNWNIAREEIMKKQYDVWKNSKTDTTKCNQSIIDKVLDKNIENLGLSQVTKLPRYAPVSLSGIDKTLDVETRRQKFIERLLGRQRRPMI